MKLDQMTGGMEQVQEHLVDTGVCASTSMLRAWLTDLQRQQVELYAAMQDSKMRFDPPGTGVGVTITVQKANNLWVLRLNVRRDGACRNETAETVEKTIFPLLQPAYKKDLQQKLEWVAQMNMLSLMLAFQIKKLDKHLGLKGARAVPLPKRQPKPRATAKTSVKESASVRIAPSARKWFEGVHAV